MLRKRAVDAYPTHDLPSRQVPIDSCNATNNRLLLTQYLQYYRLHPKVYRTAETAASIDPQGTNFSARYSAVDMLGAQARAAELQAAKSAAMRQRAHREAEDHTFPPESAPVSLTDFARNPLMSKNKGTKAFRPLIDSDFEATTVLASSRTPISDSDLSDSIRNGTSEFAPTAPRAMLARSDTNPSKITPSRVQAPTFTPRSNTTSLLIKDFDTYNGSISTSPYPVRNAAGYVFGPDDLSPTKQETKLSEMRQQYSVLPATQAPVHHFPTPFVPDARIFTSHQYQAYQYEQPSQYADTRTHFPIDTNLCNRPQLQHYQSEPGASTTIYSASQTYDDRTQSFTEDLIGHHHRLQQQSRTREPRGLSLSVQECDQPYDRNSKMQSFVAAQQAMAKKGKTVLHNPTLSKSPQQISPPMPMNHVLSTQIRSDQPKNELKDVDGIASARSSRKLEDKEAIVRAMLKRNVVQTSPTPEIQAFEGVTDEAVERELAVSEAAPDVWGTLRPITIKDRERMLRTMRAISSEPMSSSSTDLHSPLKVNLKACTKGWHHEETVTSSGRRAALINVVDDYEKRMQHSSVYGIIGRPVSKEQFAVGDRSALKAIANIMATLYDSADDYKKEPNQSPYTPAPKHALERNTSFSSPSLFDDLSFLV